VLARSLGVGVPLAGEVQFGLASLAPALADADAVVSSGGLTKYEAAYVKLPGAALSQTIEQAEETRAFSARGLTLDLGRGDDKDEKRVTAGIERLLFDTSARRSMADAGARVFPEDPTLDAARAILGVP